MPFNWKIYAWVDGQIVEYDDTQNVLLCPTYGIQVIARKDSYHGHTLVSGRDYYWHDFVNNTWEGGDTAGMIMYALNSQQQKIIFGQTIAVEDFWATYSQALNDPTLPIKTGWYPWETQPPEA